MAENVIDYVVRPGTSTWTVWRRSYDPALAWLQTFEMSRHCIREDAVLEMRERNLLHSLNGLGVAAA